MSVVPVFPRSKENVKNAIPLVFNPTLLTAGRRDRLKTKHLVECYSLVRTCLLVSNVEYTVFPLTY